jgi:hypothetical protein
VTSTPRVQIRPSCPLALQPSAVAVLASPPDPET